MTGTGNDARRPSGFLIGSIIALSFGTVFVMVNSGGLSSPWPIVIRVVGLVIAVALLVAVLRVRHLAGQGRPGTSTGSPTGGTGMWSPVRSLRCSAGST
ncbi:hypothetical protein Acy02nite_25530 [Actinoplanes cyaneus]|uniref:Uncharacterized protein n=1 Tax=Actinoplanes cyaneus TaxID=52696 RepID=A0A919M3L5_9ACTN|nr:hypothetical protein [Actinoplanes cyaneus]MCW2138117.1 hypothetical protein [Actinoplanes cyaneus]GID64672.1 hypothetical protein Acy02nite_25530 [Actinoplanes cyaneus]